MVEKFKEHWENVLCAGEEERFLALEEMILFSTCVGGWEVGKKLPDPLADSSTKLLKMDADRLETLICAVNEAELYDGKTSTIGTRSHRRILCIRLLAKKKIRYRIFEKTESCTMGNSI